MSLNKHLVSTYYVPPTLWYSSPGPHMAATVQRPCHGSLYTKSKYTILNRVWGTEQGFNTFKLDSLSISVKVFQKPQHSGELDLVKTERVLSYPRKHLPWKRSPNTGGRTPLEQGIEFNWTELPAASKFALQLPLPPRPPLPSKRAAATNTLRKSCRIHPSSKLLKRARCVPGNTLGI